MNPVGSQTKRRAALSQGMLRRAGLTDVSYWMGYFFETGFVIGCAILLMYVPLFLYPNSSGTAFLEYVDAGLFMTLLAVFGTSMVRMLCIMRAIREIIHQRFCTRKKS